MNRFLPIFLTAGLSWNLSATTSYQVVSKKGKIFVKHPMDTEWKELKTKSLQDGTLLRIDPNSRIQLEKVKEIQGKRLISRRILLNRALITRLDDDLARRMDTKDYPLRDIWDTGSESKRPANESPLLSFSASFYRSIVTLNKTPELPDVSEKGEEEAISLNVQMEKIELIYPNNGSLFPWNGEFANFPIIWTPPKNGLKYRIYIWPDTEVRSTALLEQTGSSYQASLSKSGAYYIQIEDSNHTYRSDRIRIIIDKDLDRKSGSALAREKNNIIPLFPLENSQFNSTKSSKTLVFQWKDPANEQLASEYEVVLTQKGKVFRRLKTKKRTLTMELQAGSYTWQVNRLSKIDSLKSPSLKFEISSPKEPALILSQSGKAKKAETIFLDFP